jgi:hypothetical protein
MVLVLAYPCHIAGSALRLLLDEVTAGPLLASPFWRPSAWSDLNLWVPKTCATWPDAPLTAGCSARHPAHAQPVFACQGVG